MLLCTAKHSVHSHTVTAVLQRQSSNKIHPAVSTVPRHPTVPDIVVHLCCRKGTEVLAVQPILFWLSECVQQSEIPAVTLVIPGTQ